MTYDTRRIDGTLFWLGQYTVRNKRFIELFDQYHNARERVTQDDAASLGADLEILRDWVENTTGGLGTDKEIELHSSWLNSYSESAARTVEKIKTIVEDAYAAVRELDSDFPCTRGVYAEPEEPYEILQSILTGDFPPNDGKNRYDEAMVPPVLHDGKDMFGRTVLTIDHTADMGRILEGVQRIIVSLKADSGLQDDFPSLIPAIGKRLAKKYRSSDESRAIGLLLYDYRGEFACSDAEYVRKIRAALKKDLRRKGLRPGKEDSGQRQYEDWLARTRECIEKAEVLDI